jgi:hypothetical protein
MAVSASDNDGNGTNAGHVRIYDWDGSAWTQRGNVIDGEAADDRSGNSVSMRNDGDLVAIGGRANNGAGGNSGHVRILSWEDDAWTQRGEDMDGEAEGDKSGYSVSMSGDGDAVAIGAINNSGGATIAGHVRIYDWQ